MFSQIKEIKHIDESFHSVAGVMPQVWVLGVLGVKNFSIGLLVGAPSTARSSLTLLFSNMYSGAMGLFGSYRKQTATCKMVRVVTFPI